MAELVSEGHCGGWICPERKIPSRNPPVRQRPPLRYPAVYGEGMEPPMTAVECDMSSFSATKLDISLSETPCVRCSLLTYIRLVGGAGESQAQSLVGADSAFSDGLSLRDFADRKSEVPSVF